MSPLLRVAGLALATILVPACGGGSSSAAPPPLSVAAVGGVGVADVGWGGRGGAGGALRVRASGLVATARDPFALQTPSFPPAPAGGTELTDAMIGAGTPIAGDILVSSTLQITGSADPAVITSTSGDIVIRGSLVGARSGGALTRSVTLQAPAGTIYVLGEIRTSGTAGTPDNPDGGGVTLLAQRIVLQGFVDTRGLASSSATGGKGGPVELDATGDIVCISGAIRASGGSGAAAGGDGGAVTLSAGNQLVLFSTVETDGGSASSLVAAGPAGGDGGDVSLHGGANADIRAAISASGGAATGYLEGALGGRGGRIAADGAAPYRIYGSIVTSGGDARAHQVGGFAVQGGEAGAVEIGLTTPIDSLVAGEGPWSTRGGNGNGGGTAGGYGIESLDGDIRLTATLDARGGDAAVGDAPGGAGGAVEIRTDQDASGNTANHALAIEGDVLAGGGHGSAGGGPGGSVTLRCGGDMTIEGDVVSSGGDSANIPANAGAISMVIAAANTTPDGRMDLLGDVLAEGGKGASLAGGNSVMLDAAAGISFSGTLSTKSHAVAQGTGGGDGGAVTMVSTAGDIELTGELLTTGGHAFLTPPPTPGDITISTAGNIAVSALIDLSGSSALAGNSNVPGGAGGTATFTASGPGGTIRLLQDTVIRSNGGSATAGSSNPGAGGGGILRFSTLDGEVSLTATLSARGGDAEGGAGGLGGQVVVDTDSDGDGTGGDITLAPMSSIDVSGGSGLNGGAARNNGGIAPPDSSGVNLAVVFDAGGSLAASPDGAGEGIIRNSGTITARGRSIVARGGDVWFDGRNATGAEMGPADSGTLLLTGPFGNGAFFPN